MFSLSSLDIFESFCNGKIKSIGTAARIDLERKLNKIVMLKLWCKVQKNWVNNPISLESFGIKS